MEKEEEPLFHTPRTSVYAADAVPCVVNKTHLKIERDYPNIIPSIQSANPQRFFAPRHIVPYHQNNSVNIKPYTMVII